MVGPDDNPVGDPARSDRPAGRTRPATPPVMPPDSVMAASATAADLQKAGKAGRPRPVRRGRLG